VVAAGKGNHRAALGVRAGDLDGVFNGFCTSGQKQRLFIKVARCQRIETLGQFHIRLVGQHLKAGVGVQVDLRLDGFLDLRAAVAGVEHSNATGEVNVAPALHVPDFGVVATGDENFVTLADTTWNSGAATCHQGGIGLGAGV